MSRKMRGKEAIGSGNYGIIGDPQENSFNRIIEAETKVQNI